MPWRLWDYKTQKPTFTQRLRKKETESVLKTTIFYSIFSALFISVGYIAAQARQVQNVYYVIKT